MRLVVAKSVTDPRWVCRAEVARRDRAPVAKASIADRREIDRILREQLKLGKSIREAFLKMVDRLGESIDGEELERLLREGRYGAAIDFVNSSLVGQNFSTLTSAVTNAVIDAGNTAARSATVLPGKVEFAFHATNPKTVQFLRSYQMNMIAQIGRQTRATVRAVITEGMTNGRNPITMARDIKTMIGLTDKQAGSVLNFRRMLETGDKAALQRALRDKRFDATVANAIENGNPLSAAQIDKMVTRYTERFIKYRAETIARTEAVRAREAGNKQLWQQTVDDGKLREDQIKRFWIYTHDGKTREAHETIEDLNPDGVGLNEPFRSQLGPIMYPGDPNATAGNTINCRCTVVTRFSL